jgi:hypothetical protein
MKNPRAWPALSLSVLCLHLGCGGQPPEPETPASTPEPKLEATSPLPAKSESSDALRAVGPDSTVVVRVHGDRLRSGPIFKALTGVRDAVPQAKQGLMIVQAGCGFDPLEAIQELVIAAQHKHQSSPDEPLGRMELDPTTATVAILLNRPAEDALACIANFLPVERKTVGNDPALLLPSGAIVQAHHELLISTPKDQAEAANDRIRKTAPLDPQLQAILDANPEAAVLGFARGQNTLNLKWGSLAASQPGGAVDLKAVGLAESPEAATKLAAAVEEQRRMAKEATQQLGPQFEPVRGLLDRVKLEQQGASVSLHLALDKAEAESFAGMLVALTTESVGKYALSAKTAEARDYVMRIALALSDHARAQRAPKTPFPTSAPASPAVVPGKQAVDAQGAFQHPSWKAIGFEPRGPVFYSYQFVTARDGKSVEVIAAGDLDGDGKQSKYSVKVSMDGKEPRIDPELVRQDPYE